MKSARERMDIIAAYREVGTYRGAAEMCGTTHKTVKRVVRARTRPAAGRRSGRRGPATTTRSPSWSRSGWRRRRAGSRRSGCCRSPGRPGMRVGAELPAAGREAESGVAQRIITAAVARRCGRRVRPGHRLGRGRAGAARVLRGAGLVAVPVRAVRRRTRRPTTTLAMLAEVLRGASAGSRPRCWPTGWAA